MEKPPITSAVFEGRVRFGVRDMPLREDVSFLGGILGEVLHEQGGAELFDRVETARRAAIRRREGDPGAASELAALLAGLEPVMATEVVRAFSAYFSLVNLAEQVHRIRRRHHSRNDPGSAPPGSLAAAVAALASEGLGAERLRELIRRTRVVPVFTAHPTEATRRTILAKEQRVARLLVDRIGRTQISPEERHLAAERLRTEVTLIWQTEEQPAARPAVADEVEHVLFYLSDVIYRTVPAFYEALSAALEATFGGGAGRVLPATVLRFASWVGGDMDGNPNVGPETIIATLERQRELILERYRSDVRHLFDHLSQSLSMVGVDDAVVERCRRYRALLPEASKAISARYDDMPYRVLLWLMWERLEATKHDAAGAYGDPRELIADLRLISDSLATNRGDHAGRLLVERLLQRAETFAFNMATLDVRQDALVHRQAVACLLGDPAFADREADERTVILQRALDRAGQQIASPSPDLEHTLAVLRAIGEARGRFGDNAVGPYIISMAQGADDVLAVLLLARHAGLADGDGHNPLDVAPLFETVDDLERARPSLEAMLADPCYRRHLAGRDDEQIVMLGYSDSSKISGISASRWSLYRAQEEMVAAAEAAGIRLTLFHGRGGTVGRGGSKPRAAILGDPCGAVRGHLRITEQGEIINLKYGLEGIAERTLELMTGAVLEATAACDRRAAVPPEWMAAMETVAAGGRSAYHALVHSDPDFIPYFRAATPIDVIERLEIGSRPASRRSGRGVENLRAIPWVFAWMQSRHVLPGWYGVGSGLQQAVDEHGEEALRAMTAGWPFFANLLADVEMVLAKADMAIAARYAELADEAGARVFPVIERQFATTRRLVTRLQGTEEILDGDPTLQRSIRLRNPYIDPISLVQIDLLRSWRAGGRRDPDLERALVTTVRGIARGLRNTG